MHTYMKNKGLLRRLTIKKTTNTINENQQEQISKSAWTTIIIVSSTLLVMMLGDIRLEYIIIIEKYDELSRKRNI